MKDKYKSNICTNFVCTACLMKALYLKCPIVLEALHTKLENLD